MAETDEVAENPDALVGEILGGKYQIVAFMDRGAIGAVYKAIQLSVGREVVLKVLRPKVSVLTFDPNFAARFRREASTYGKLRHPNTVTLFDYGEHEHGGSRLYYMAMEFVRGRTLRKLLKVEGRFGWERAVDVALQILPSLREAHGIGIVHRDLKPGNVMLTDEGEGERVKVLDFGVAKVLVDEAGDTTEDALTQTGTLLGSPHYMAPEQMRVGRVDGRTDIYALGCILFEMLAGTPPYRGNSVIEICAAHLSKPIPTLESVARAPLEVSPELASIVRKCLEKDPDARWQTVEELVRALKELRDVSELGSLHRRTATPVPVSRPAERRTVPLVWVAVLLLLVAIPTALLGAGTVAILLSLAPPTDPGGPVAPVVPADVAEVLLPTGPTVSPEPSLPPVPSAPIYRITSTPAGARLSQGTTELGVTPLALDRLPDGGAPLVLQLSGYRDATVTVDELRTGGAVARKLVPKVAPKAGPEPFRPDVRTQR